VIVVGAGSTVAVERGRPFALTCPWGGVFRVSVDGGDGWEVIRSDPDRVVAVWTGGAQVKNHRWNTTVKCVVIELEFQIFDPQNATTPPDLSVCREQRDFLAVFGFPSVCECRGGLVLSQRQLEYLRECQSRGALLQVGKRDELIALLLGRDRWEELDSDIHRTEVGHPCVRIGGGGRFSRRGMKPWTDEEREIVRTHPTVSADSLMDLLPGRTRSAIESKRGELRREDAERGVGRARQQKPRFMRRRRDDVIEGRRSRLTSDDSEQEDEVEDDVEDFSDDSDLGGDVEQEEDAEEE
jgi:hypothetical protein